MCEVIEKYRAEALTEGMMKGKAEDIIEMLKDKLSVEKIAQYTSVPIEEIVKIGKKYALL